MTGSGNDFVFVDGRTANLPLWSDSRIRSVCSRHHGVGADGLAIVEPGASTGTVRLHYFNADGSRAALCGNASLCATRFAALLELAPAGGMLLETDSGLLRTRCLSGERAELLVGEIPEVQTAEIELEAGETAAGFVMVGVPHLVIRVSELDGVPVRDRGRILRHHPSLGPSGANVNFVARDGDGSWRVRTYERGVENETLACGTGAVATAAALTADGQTGLPCDIQVASGARLVVSEHSVDGQGLALSGEGRLVFRAVLSG